MVSLFNWRTHECVQGIIMAGRSHGDVIADSTGLCLVPFILQERKFSKSVILGFKKGGGGGGGITYCFKL